jgi:type III restriction enzyme
MLTEGWDCNTVTHIVGLRPFMSQLLCEQVVGRGLRRMSYDVDENGLFTEEVAKVFGVPFEVIPFKATKGQATPRPKRHHVQALPARSAFEIVFPRVEGYTQAIRNRLVVNWDALPTVVVDPMKIPPEVDVKGLNLNNKGRLTLSGPGRLDEVSLREFRAQRRLQELVFELARSLARDFLAQGHCEIPAHTLFPQLVAIVDRYVETKIRAVAPADKKDAFLSPYYGWIVERLVSAIRPDTTQGEAPEIPRYEANRPPGTTADVDFWTSRDVCEVNRSHVNYVVADTLRWEQAAAFHIDRHEATDAFVKNASLGFFIPYLHNGQRHDYLPDFIVRLNDADGTHLILETKGYDPLAEVKIAAARRWVAAVNADGSFGKWRYEIARGIEEVNAILDASFHGQLVAK